MKQLIPCYRNWRIDAILLAAIVALLLITGEGETLLANIIGVALLLADLIVAKRWHNQGRLPQLDNITE